LFKGAFDDALDQSGNRGGGSMQKAIKHLTGDEVPQGWRPTWVTCWVVEMDGKTIAGPYATREEAQAVMDGEQDPKVSQTPTPR
jgi:hypothetical protein